MTGYWEPTAPRGRLWCNSVGALPTAARRTRCTSDVITLVRGGGPLPDRVQSLLRRNSLGRAATKAMRVAQRSFGKDAALTCKYVGKESEKLTNTSIVQVSWHMVGGVFKDSLGGRPLRQRLCSGTTVSGGVETSLLPTTPRGACSSFRGRGSRVMRRRD